MNHACINCGKGPLKFTNYCDWDCQVEYAVKQGGKMHTPNGLPVKSIDQNWNCFEHEHSDHPTYLFPVVAEYIGPLSYFTFVDPDGIEKPMSPEEIERERVESHALIYTDGTVAVTMYEHCYAMWYISSGKFGGGSLWRKGEWKLSEQSIAKIIDHAGKQIEGCFE